MRLGYFAFSFCVHKKSQIHSSLAFVVGRSFICARYPVFIALDKRSDPICVCTCVECLRSNEPQHLLEAVACGYEALPVRSRAPHLPRHSVEVWPELPRFVHINPFGRICANRDHLVILSGRHFSLTSKTIRAFSTSDDGARRDLEHKAGIEPACSRFADDCLTTWLLMQTWSPTRESNSDALSGTGF